MPVLAAALPVVPPAALQMLLHGMPTGQTLTPPPPLMQPAEPRPGAPQAEEVR